MNAEIRFKDKRILEALEYIDEKYIDDVFDVLKEPAYSKGDQMKISPFRLWRYYIAAAACLLVLALAIPILGMVADVINSFAAGWGDSTEESTEDLNTVFTEPINTDPYSINQAELDLINAAWAKYTNIKDTIYCSNPEDINYLSGGCCFYGKYNGCIILYRTSVTCVYWEYEVNGHLFRIPSGEIWVCRYGEPYSLYSVYENGWLSDEDIEEIWERHNENAWKHSDIKQ
jgi:hypothetical protein